MTILQNKKMTMFHIYMDNSLFALNEKELLQWIFDEKLSPTAQVQKGHKKAWNKLSETSEWKLFYDYSYAEKNWILLKRPGKTKSPFKQKGPYKTSQIVFFLKTGLCSDRDFVWKKNFREWKRISLVSDFSTHPAHTVEDLLTQQNRKYKTQKARMVRYSPSAPSLDWFELQKAVQDFY